MLNPPHHYEDIAMIGGQRKGSETAEAAPTSGETQRPASESLTDGTPPSASGSTDQSEFKSAKG